MEKIKATFTRLSVYLGLVLVAAVGILLHLLTKKQRENEELKLRLSIANTQKEVDLIETEIKRAAEQREQTQENLKALSHDLELISQKRQELKDSRTDLEVEEYWDIKKDE